MSEFFFEGGPIQALPGETVLDSLLRSEKSPSYGCKNGSCQSCMLRSPEAPPAKSQVGLAEVFKEANCFLACKCPADQVTSVELVGEDVLPKYRATAIERETISRDVLRLRLTAEGLKVKAGMFVRLIMPDGTKRSYSVANSFLVEEDYLEFHIRILPDGKMSQYLATSQNPELLVEGPFGNCVYAAHPNQPIVFIGSGTGLAPLYAVLTEALSTGHSGSCTLYFGSSTADGLYFKDELVALERQFPNVQVQYCSDTGSSWTNLGSPVDVALAHEGNFAGKKVYTCGHPELVKAAKKKTFLAGASMADIHSDSFDSQR